MRTALLLLLPVFFLVSQTSCEHLTEQEKTAKLSTKIREREIKEEERNKRRVMRREAEDRSYHDWWRSLMGQ